MQNIKLKIDQLKKMKNKTKWKQMIVRFEELSKQNIDLKKLFINCLHFLKKNFC